MLLLSLLVAAGSVSAEREVEYLAGQMLMIGFGGTVLDEDATVLEDIRDYNIGGVILFKHDGARRRSRNIDKPEQLRALIEALQRAAVAPLFVAVDQEGGWVRRLGAAFDLGDRGTSAAFFGDMGYLDNGTSVWAGRNADVLADVGINMNLAPVVDLERTAGMGSISRLRRSYSSDPDVVYEHARAFIEPHQQRGVLTVLKHFPGLGSVQHDPHVAAVDATWSWHPDELRPYRRLTGEGVCDAVMVAHVMLGHLDAEHPASLSRAIVTGLLRRRLGFDGVVISDDLAMPAVTRHYTFEQMIELAINAGVDVLLLGNHADEAVAERAVAVIVGLVKSGKVSIERLRQSGARIAAAKARMR